MEFDQGSDSFIKRVAKLLGVGPECLLAGLWKRTHNIKGTLFTRKMDKNEWQLARAGLALHEDCLHGRQKSEQSSSCSYSCIHVS